MEDCYEWGKSRQPEGHIKITEERASVMSGTIHEHGRQYCAAKEVHFNAELAFHFAEYQVQHMWESKYSLQEELS